MQFTVVELLVSSYASGDVCNNTRHIPVVFFLLSPDIYVICHVRTVELCY